MPILLYDANSKGATNFLNLAKEFLKRNDDGIKVKKKKAKVA